METSSSSFILSTKYNSRFISPYQYFNTDSFKTTSDNFGFIYDTCNMNGNLIITGNILSIDFRSFRIYTSTDFNLNDKILAEDNIIINPNNSNITCDIFTSSSTQNYVYSNQYILSNVFSFFERSQITNLRTEDYQLFSNNYVNIISQNNLFINSNSIKIQGNNIFFYPLNRYNLKGNYINIKQKNDQLITRTSISTNTLHFIANNDLRFKTNTISYITDLFSANVKNIQTKGNNFSIQTNSQKKLALSVANIYNNTESAIFQGYDHNFKSNFAFMKSNASVLNNNLFYLNSNNITFINNTNEITANVIYLSCKANTTANLHNFKLITGENNLSSKHVRIINKNEMKFALKNIQILANTIQKDAKVSSLESNICYFRFERNNIDGNNVVLQSNTFVINNMRTQINSNISNFAYNFNILNTPVLTWVNKQEWILTVRLLSNVLTSEMKMTFNSSTHWIEKLNINSYRKILNFIQINANIAERLLINGNVSISTKKMNWQSNVFSIYTAKSILIYSNQIIGAISNEFPLRSNALSIQTPILNIQSNLHFTQTDCTLIANAITIKSNNLNLSSGNITCNTKSIIINNPNKVEILSKNIYSHGNGFLINNKITVSSQLNNLTGTFKSVNLNTTHFENIDCNDLKLNANFITINANILKIDSSVSIYSNNFLMNGNNTFNLFKMTTVDSLRIINSNYNLTNYDSFLATFDRGSIFVPNITIRHKNTTILSNMLAVGNCKTFELNANINSLQLADLSYNGSRHAFIRSKALTMTSSNLKTVSNVLNIAGNLTIVSNVGNFNISNCNFTVDQFRLTNPNLTINANKTFLMTGNHLNVQSNNTVSAKGIVESNLNMNHAIIKSNLDVGSNDMIIKSNTIELVQTAFEINNTTGKSTIQMDHARANIGLNRFDLQFQNANFLNSEHMQITHSNTISIECYGSHGLNADRVANITGNIFQFVVHTESQFTASNMRILFEKANIVSNASFFTEYINASISCQDWNIYPTNNTVINSKQFDLNQNMVILTAPSVVKIDASIQVASMSNQTNMTASNSFSMRSNALITNTQIFNIDSKQQVLIESTDLATKLINSNIQCNAVILNANGLFITSKLISAASNDRIRVNLSKLTHTSNKVDLSVLNGNIRSNQMLISSNNLNYTVIDLTINSKHSANINCLTQVDVEFTNNTFIYANNLQINSVLSVFDVFTFDMKKDASVRKRLYTPTLNPLGNTLQFINAEKLNILNGYYNINGNIGFNPSSNVMINIGTDNCILNLKGDLNYINTNEYDFNSRNIFFNSNAKGSGTARGSGIYIRDNNDNGNVKSYVLVSDNGIGYTFKPPETENTLKLQFDLFTQSGFLKCVQNASSQFYNLQPERLQISTVGLLNTVFTDKLNLSGGSMTGNLIMGANKITSSNTNSDPTDISNLTYASTKLPLSGGTMIGSIAMNSSKISSTFEPVSNVDLVNKHYLDSNKLPLSGGTLSGNLDLQDFRMSSNFVASSNSDLTNRKFLYDNYLPWVGGAMKGNIEYVNSAYKITSNHEASAKPDITNKLYVDSTRVSTITNVVMVGNIIMSGNTKLTSNFYAVANADITNKKYTDDNLVNLVGDNLTGNLHMGQSFKISSNHVPIFNTDITNRKYLMSNILSLKGGVMLGNIVMSSIFKIASNYLASANSDLTNKEFMDKNFVFLKGNNILKGNLNLESNGLTSNAIATDKWDIVNKKYADDTLLSRERGVMNGNITMSATYKLSSNFTPIADSDITNKQYLDMNFCSLRGNTLTGNLNMSGLFKLSSNNVAASNSDITNKLFIESNVLKLNGGTMFGNIHMGDKKITMMATPTQNSDLTNKQYADTKYSVLGGDTLSGNLTLNSNLVLTQQSRIIHKNGTVLFRGNVLLRSSNFSVGGNLICENLPQVQSLPAFHLINANDLIPKSYIDTKVDILNGRSTGDTHIIGNIDTRVIYTPRFVTVVAGDYLILIAQRELGDGNRWLEIYELNIQIIGNNPNLIYPGQRLQLPGPHTVSIRSNVYMRPNRTIYANTITSGILQIGMQNKFLKLLGATTKGSLLVGNNTNTEELLLGGNDTILKIVNQSVNWEKNQTVTITLLTQILVNFPNNDSAVSTSSMINLTNGGTGEFILPEIFNTFVDPNNVVNTIRVTIPAGITVIPYLFETVGSYGVNPSLTGLNVPINCAQVNAKTTVLTPNDWNFANNFVYNYPDMIIHEANLPASLVGQNPILHFIDLWLPANATLTPIIQIFQGTSSVVAADYRRNTNGPIVTGPSQITAIQMEFSVYRIYAVDLLTNGGTSFIRPFQGGFTQFRIRVQLNFVRNDVAPLQMGTNGLPCMTVNMSRCNNLMTNNGGRTQSITTTFPDLTIPNRSNYRLGFLPIGINNPLTNTMQTQFVSNSAIRYTCTLEYTLLRDFAVLLSSSNGSFFKSNLIFNSALNRLQTKNLLINKTIELPGPLKSNAPNELMIQSVILEILQRATKLQVSKTSTAIDAYYPILFENSNAPLRIQLNPTVSYPATNTSTILKMDTIQIGNEVVISMSDSAIFQVGNMVQIGYNSNNVVRGSVLSKTSTTIQIKITSIQRSFATSALINTNDLNKQIVSNSDFNPRSFFRLRTLQSAISKSNITYSICDINGVPFSVSSPPLQASFLTVNNNRIQILADQNAANARSTFFYTLKAEISATNFVFINLKQEYTSSTNSFTCTFTNNSSVFSNSITWVLPSAGVVFSGIQQYNYIFFLPSAIVVQTVGVLLSGLKSGGVVDQIKYRVNILNNQVNSASTINENTGQNLSTIQNSVISGLQNGTPSPNTGFVYGPNGNDLVIQIAPSSTQASGITGWQYQSSVSTQGGSNSFVGVINAYSIDYSVGAVSLDNTNNIINLMYFPKTGTLSTNGLSTTFLPRLNESKTPSVSNELVSKRYADQQVLNVSSIRFIQVNLANYSLLLKSSSLMYATINNFYNANLNRLNSGSSITQWSREAASVRLGLGWTIAQTNITPGLIPLNTNSTNLFGNDSTFHIQDTGNRSYLGLGANTPSFPLHITIDTNSRIVETRYVDAPGRSRTLCCSANGAIVLRGLSNGITISRNSGETSTYISMGVSQYYVSCSLDGQFMFVNNWNGSVVYNNGSDWTSGTTNGTWSMSGAYTRGPFQIHSATVYYSFTLTLRGGNGNNQFGGYLNLFRNGNYMNRIFLERGDYVFFHPDGSPLIASSDDLSVMYVAPGAFATPGLLLQVSFNTSTGTFGNINYIYLPQTQITGVDCSSNGSVIFVVSKTSTIYRSLDSGSTWQQLARTAGQPYNYNGWDGTSRTMYLPGNAFPIQDPTIACVSCNSTGQIVLIGLMLGLGLFYSSNSGTDWIYINNSSIKIRPIYYTAVPKNFTSIVGAYANQDMISNFSNLAIIEIPPPPPALWASGAVRSLGQLTSSDNRLKFNINQINEQIIQDIRFVKTKTYKMIKNDQKYIGLLAQNVEKIYSNSVFKQIQIIPNIMIWVSIISTQDLHYAYPTKNIYKVCTLDPRQKIKFKAYHPKIELKNEQGQIITAHAIHIQNNKQFYIELGNNDYPPGKYLLIGEECDDYRTIEVSNIYTVKEAYAKMMAQMQLQTKNRIIQLTERLSTFQQLLEKQNEMIRLCAEKRNIGY